jgi:hypothetical protein
LNRYVIVTFSRACGKWVRPDRSIPSLAAANNAREWPFY